MAVLGTGCADSYLDQYPSGGTITEDQYLKMDNVIERIKQRINTFYCAFNHVIHL